MKTGMDFEVSCSVDDEKQFWDELDDILAAQCDSHATIDNVLRSYLGLTTKYKDAFLPSLSDISQCSERLLDSNLFSAHAEYVRRQIVYSLLQEEASDVLLVIVSLLLYDGRRNEGTFEMLSEEGGFVRLLEMIQSLRGQDGANGAGLHRLLMDLMYEMSRIQRIRIQDLVLVDDDFVKHLFEIIERLSDDANDPYHYPVIRVLLILNEQFMVTAHDPAGEGSSTARPTNKVIKVLSMYRSVYKTFGENIILLLNRENETSLQLLTLKLLYLLFTTPSTYEYFYTNDLRVLVDILIRNLLDLPEEAAALRHTYLRVLHPLLVHTQLRHPPHYKRDEVRKLLGILVRSDFAGLKEHCEKILHFEEVDETTRRLVLRCSQTEWLADEDEITDRPAGGNVDAVQPEIDSNNAGQNTVESEGDSPPQITLAVNSTNTQHETARSSSISVVKVASQKEKPGVLTPSKKDNMADLATALPPPKQKPEPPKARRSRARRRREESGDGRAHDSRDRDTPVTHQGRTLEKQKSFDRVAASEPPSSHSRSIHGDVPPSTTSSPADAQFVPPSSDASSSAKIPKIRVHHSSLSPHPPAVPPPRRSSHSVPPPPHTEQRAGRLNRRHPHPPQTHQSSVSPQPSPLPTVSTATNGHTKKPDPPKTRRWWTQQAHQQSHAAGDGKSGSEDSTTITDRPDSQTIDQRRADVRSVENGIDKIKLGGG